MKEKEIRKYLVALYIDSLNYYQIQNENLLAQLQSTQKTCVSKGIDLNRLVKVTIQAINDIHK